MSSFGSALPNTLEELRSEKLPSINLCLIGLLFHQDFASVQRRRLLRSSLNPLALLPEQH
jgi:hypothetical protein